MVRIGYFPDYILFSLKFCCILLLSFVPIMIDEVSVHKRGEIHELIITTIIRT